LISSSHHLASSNGRTLRYLSKLPSNNAACLSFNTIPSILFTHLLECLLIPIQLLPAHLSKSKLPIRALIEFLIPARIFIWLHFYEISWRHWILVHIHYRSFSALVLRRWLVNDVDCVWIIVLTKCLPLQLLLLILLCIDISLLDLSFRWVIIMINTLKRKRVHLRWLLLPPNRVDFVQVSINEPLRIINRPSHHSISSYFILCTLCSLIYAASLVLVTILTLWRNFLLLDNATRVKLVTHNQGSIMGCLLVVKLSY